MDSDSTSNKSEKIITSICIDVITKKIPNTNIKYFDLVLLIPSLIFSIFLIFHCRNIVKTMMSNNSSIVNTFYVLLCTACCLKVIRASVVMFLDTSIPAIQIADKVLWLIVRFFLLATEMSIITFGVAAARVDSRTGIRRVLVIAALVSLSYTAVQASLEFAKPDERFRVNSYSLYGHGGALFVSISSLFFLAVYCSILLLPLCGSCGRRLRLPTKRMFYGYCAILAALYSVQSVGSIVFFMQVNVGLCLIDATTLAYFTCYDPLVYATFLHNYIRSRRVLSWNYNDTALRLPDTSEELYKARSSVTNSSGQQHQQQYQLSPGQRASTEFSPDCMVTLAGDADLMNICRIMKDFNILSQGAQMEFTNRCPPSSVVGGDLTSLYDDDDDDDDDREHSVILSISEEVDTPRRKNWDLADFAGN